MDWLANVRLHPLDKLLGDSVQFIPILLLGFSNAPLIAYTIFLGFHGFPNHSNVNFKFGPLRFVFSSPVFNHWHHCNAPTHYSRNFPPHLVIWDLLLGTAYIPPSRIMPRRFGVPDSLPEDFVGQMASPFRPPPAIERRRPGSSEARA